MDTTKINIKYIFCFPADVWVFNKHELAHIGGKDIVHYGDVTMGAIASQITSITIVYSTVYSDADQRKHQSSASLAFVWGIHRGPVNSPHKWPVTRKMFPFDDVITWKPSVFAGERPSSSYITALFRHFWQSTRRTKSKTQTITYYQIQCITGKDHLSVKNICDG